MAIGVNPTMNIPDTSSDANAWKQWHISLKRTFGRKTANAIWVTGWNKRGNKDIIDHNLREHLGKSGIVLDESMLGKLSEAGSDYLDNLSDIFKVGKYVAFAVVGIAVIGAGMAIFNIARQPLKAAGAAAQLRGAGAMKGMK